MPVDVEVALNVGKDGLNLRDQPAEVPIAELVDSVNWRIDENGALVKRLGYAAYASSGPLAAVPLEQATFNPAGGTTALLFYCADGHVYSSPGDGTFTSIASGLSTTARPTFATLNDKIYWSNGTDNLQQWTGSVLTSIASAPKGKYLAVWRNRLWVAGVASAPRTVYWSNISDPTNWNALNFVDIHGLRGDQITGLVAAPNIGTSFDGADGLLVYMKRSTHRIFDDTDNANGAIVGGGNVLIDGGTGTSSHRSLVHLNGRVWSVCQDGIYSTDGHASLRLESGRLGSFFRNAVNPAFLANALGRAWQGNYWLSVASTGSGINDLILEVYASFPPTIHGDQPLMAHRIPVAAWSIYPAATGDQLIFCDASTTPSDNRLRVRQYGVGGADTDGQATSLPIAASARSGAWTFGTPHPKRIRRVQATGRGTVTLGVATDLERSIGETRTFIMPVSEGPFWNTVNWNQFQWGPLGGVTTNAQWYTRRGRVFQLTVNESSTDIASTTPRLGAATSISGGAALYNLIVRFTPLDAE